MYHHKRDKEHLKYVSMEQISDMLPTGEFIAIFGTSHTRGCCEKNDIDVTHIDTAYTWPHIISEKLNIEYFNFAVPGNTNQVMVQQIIDFMDIPGAKERCKMIIVESRFGDIAGRYFFDLFADDYYKDKIESQSFLSASIGSNHWLDEISGMFVPKSSNDYVENLVRNSTPDFEDYVPQPAVDLLKEIIQVYMKSALSSSNLIVDDLLHLRTMKSLAECANIPFRCFFWDKNKVSSSSAYFKKIANLIEDMYNLNNSNIKTLMPNVNESCYAAFGEDLWRDTDCDCGHRDHRVHEWVAKQIVEELKDDFRS